jgi:hypothetical protein
MSKNALNALAATLNLQSAELPLLQPQKALRLPLLRDDP